MNVSIMNINLKRTGYYREMPHAYESDPSIKDYIGKNIDDVMKKKICKYLDSGKVLVACYGLAADIINPERGTAGCPSMMTDGTWVWPGDLAYYVDEYSLKLSPDFIETMRDSDWEINLSDEESIDYDTLLIEGKKLIE